MTESLFWIGLILLLGYLGERLTSRLRLPGVSGYILIGAAISPDSFGLLPADLVHQTEPLLHLALAMVGFLIGGSLEWKRLGRLGRGVVGILFAQFYATILLVSVGLFFALPLLTDLPADRRSLAVALLFGLIAAATAPAATLAVIHQYHAKGVLTTTVLAVVAADDGLALATYSLLAPTAVEILGASTVIGRRAALHGMSELLLSGGLGLAGGFVAQFLRQVIMGTTEALPIFAISLLFYGIALHFQLNALLVAMIMGFTLANLAGRFDEIARGLRSYEDPLFTLFFILSGAHLDPALIAKVWPVAVAFVVFRFLGKTTGVYMGAILTHSPPSIRKYGGLALLPQAGVALGLALLVASHLRGRPEAAFVMNVTIATVIINEVVGPAFTRFALFRAGEARETRDG